MSFGRQQRPRESVLVEFDISGRTYRVALERGEATPMYIGGNLVNQVQAHTDLITGADVIIIWSHVGAIRVLGPA